MKFKVSVKEIRLDEDRIKRKVTNDRFGMKAATEWKKLIGPYTPRDTGRLEETATVSPFTIRYAPANPLNGYVYSAKVYYGVGLNFQKTHNPYATHHWDKAAEQAGKKTDLYRELNSELRSGNY